MMETCPNCGFEGQAGARFCRQCGAPLFIERPATLAETRQQASPGAAYSQGWTGDSRSYQSANTSRVARPPAPAGGAYAVPVPRDNAQAFWALTGLICALATSGLILASMFSIRPNRARTTLREAISAEIREDVRRESERAVRQAEELARLSAEKARAAADAARVAGEAARAQGAIAPGADVLSLDSLIYPGATVTSRISAGNQTGVLKLETSDDIARVREFYAARLGEPRNASKARLTFALSDRGVDVAVNVGPGKARGSLDISIARSGRKNP